MKNLIRFFGLEITEAITTITLTIVGIYLAIQVGVVAVTELFKLF